MTNKLKGRFVTYYKGDKQAGTIEKQARFSLNAVKVNFGIDIARVVLTKKVFILSNRQWIELELIPGEKNAEETEKTERLNQLCRALYSDLRKNYPSLTLAIATADVGKLIAGGEPTGIIQMVAQPYLVQLGLLEGVKV